MIFLDGKRGILVRPRVVVLEVGHGEKAGGDCCLSAEVLLWRIVCLR